MQNIFNKYLILLLSFTGFICAMENSFEDFYSLLNVPKEADQTALTASINNLYKDVYPKLIIEEDPKKEAEIKKEFRKGINRDFRKSIIAYILLSNSKHRQAYDKKPNDFKEAFHLYSILDLPLNILQKTKKSLVIPQKITPKNAIHFFSCIPLKTLSDALLSSRNDDTIEAYYILSDSKLRSLYHKNPTPLSFNTLLELLKERKNKHTSFIHSGLTFGSRLSKLTRTSSSRSQSLNIIEIKNGETKN